LYPSERRPTGERVDGPAVPEGPVVEPTIREVRDVSVHTVLGLQLEPDAVVDAAVGVEVLEQRVAVTRRRWLVTRAVRWELSVVPGEDDTLGPDQRDTRRSTGRLRRLVEHEQVELLARVAALLFVTATTSARPGTSP